MAERRKRRHDNRKAVVFEIMAKPRGRVGCEIVLALLVGSLCARIMPDHANRNAARAVPGLPDGSASAILSALTESSSRDRVVAPVGGENPDAASRHYRRLGNATGPAGNSLTTLSDGVGKVLMES